MEKEVMVQYGGDFSNSGNLAGRSGKRKASAGD